MVNKFTQKAGGALSAALTLAQELGHSYIGTEHLLLGLVSQKDSIASRILILRGASESKIRQSIVDCMGIGSKSDICSDDMTPRLRTVIESAAEEAQRTGTRYVGTEHLLIALLNRRDCVAIRLLEASGICVSEIKSDLVSYLGSAPYRAKESSCRSDEESKKTKKDPLLSYGNDLTELAASGKTDPVLCRETETERIIRILCRRTKNNPCLVGEPGVGKTAVVEGLAQRICAGDVPPELRGKKIITLDIPSMIAGAKYRGEFEDRIKAVIEAVRKKPDVILFVDEMHVMVGAGGAEGAIDASNILKPALARGEIRMIGATTTEEYRSHIEKDAAFERRFQPVTVEEPSEENCKEILRGLRERYQSHHAIYISEEAIDAAVRLSSRYINERFLPDKAIDLIDEACSKLRLSSLLSNNADSAKKEIEAQKEAAVLNKDFALASSLASQERELALTDSKKEAELPTLTADDIAALISEQTGIPCHSLLESEGERLGALEDIINEKLIGQSKAVSAVANAVRRGRVGLCDPHRPIGSFMFLGSSGVGKTELCKILASSVYQRKDALIRFDMSEYMEKHSVSKLIGAPPGYVGYGEGGLLSEKVRKSPHSVVLFDEIEKAHPDVFNILLQILEDGRLTDSVGRTADFSSTIIVMTSNLISSNEAKCNRLGFGESESETKNEIRQNKKLREFFRPEFLNRIDDIILFEELTQDSMCAIANIMLEQVVSRAKDIGIKLTVAPEVALTAVKACASAHKDSGARYLRREISEIIEFPLSKKILCDKSREWVVFADSGSICIQSVTNLIEKASAIQTDALQDRVI